MHSNAIWFAVCSSIVFAATPTTGLARGEDEPQSARPAVQEAQRIRDEEPLEGAIRQRDLDTQDPDDDTEASEQDERTRWLSRLRRLRTEHSRKLAELRQLTDDPEPDADTAIVKDAAEIIGLPEQALGMIDKLRFALKGEAEEVHLERVVGRLEYLHGFLELRHVILDLSRQLRTATNMLKRTCRCWSRVEAAGPSAPGESFAFGPIRRYRICTFSRSNGWGSTPISSPTARSLCRTCKGSVCAEQGTYRRCHTSPSSPSQSSLFPTFLIPNLPRSQALLGNAVIGKLCFAALIA